MILDFPGGARPDERTHLGKKEIENITDCSAVCLKADCERTVLREVNDQVKRGSLLGENDGTPVYSPISGVFRGVLELEGFEYFGEWIYRQIGCLGTRKFINDRYLIKNIKKPYPHNKTHCLDFLQFFLNTLLFQFEQLVYL